MIGLIMHLLLNASIQPSTAKELHGHNTWENLTDYVLYPAICVPINTSCQCDFNVALLLLPQYDFRMRFARKVENTLCLLIATYFSQYGHKCILFRKGKAGYLFSNRYSKSPAFLQVIAYFFSF